MKTYEGGFGNPDAASGAMPIAKITSQGLGAIALLVALLWGCILAENSITKAARMMRVTSLQELRQLRGGLRKVNAPGKAPAWLGSERNRRA